MLLDAVWLSLVRHSYGFLEGHFSASELAANIC